MRALLHEIRNHLAVGIANVEAFRDGVLAPTQERLDAVLQALAQANALLDELRGFDQPVPRTGVQRTVDVCEVISNEVTACEAAAREKGIALQVTRCGARHDGCGAFACDPVHIAEIVNNVVANAIRYTPRGGRIDVDCRHADGLTLVVSDTGPGVPANERERIFDAGFRGSASAAAEGSGIGLALVRRFVEEHGGTVRVDGVAGEGARFTVNLPPA